MKTETTQNVHQSKWGFHPCSWETCQKLKRLSIAHQQSLREDAALTRWEAKLPHNRVLKRWKRNEQGQRIGYEIVGPSPRPVVKNTATLNCRHNVLSEYQNARRPKKTAEDVRPLNLTVAEIDALLEQIK